ncbi:hypothetical protein K440DRAFT_628437, partial [Wilcoxina mikolae CBS 423.85]
MYHSHRCVSKMVTRNIEFDNHLNSIPPPHQHHLITTHHPSPPLLHHTPSPLPTDPTTPAISKQAFAKQASHLITSHHVIDSKSRSPDPSPSTRYRGNAYCTS